MPVLTAVVQRSAQRLSRGQHELDVGAGEVAALPGPLVLPVHPAASPLRHPPQYVPDQQPQTPPLSGLGVGGVVVERLVEGDRGRHHRHLIHPAAHLQVTWLSWEMVAPSPASHPSRGSPTGHMTQLRDGGAITGISSIPRLTYRSHDSAERRWRHHRHLIHPAAHLQVTWLSWETVAPPPASHPSHGSPTGHMTQLRDGGAITGISSIPRLTYRSHDSAERRWRHHRQLIHPAAHLQVTWLSWETVAPPPASHPSHGSPTGHMTQLRDGGAITGISSIPRLTYRSHDSAERWWRHHRHLIHPAAHLQVTRLSWETVAPSPASHPSRGSPTGHMTQLRDGGAITGISSIPRLTYRSHDSAERRWRHHRHLIHPAAHLQVTWLSWETVVPSPASHPSRGSPTGHMTQLRDGGAITGISSIPRLTYRSHDSAERRGRHHRHLIHPVAHLQVTWLSWEMVAPSPASHPSRGSPTGHMTQLRDGGAITGISSIPWHTYRLDLYRSTYIFAYIPCQNIT